MFHVCWIAAGAFYLFFYFNELVKNHRSSWTVYFRGINYPYTMNSMFFFLFFKWPAPLICSAILPIHFFELLSIGEIGRD